MCNIFIVSFFGYVFSAFSWQLDNFQIEKIKFFSVVFDFGVESVTENWL